MKTHRIRRPARSRVKAAGRPRGRVTQLGLITLAILWLQAAPVAAQPANPPTGLVAYGGDQHVAVVWDELIDANLDGFNVYRGQVQGGPYTQINSGLVAPESHSYDDQGLVNGAPYFYVVTAVPIVGDESAYSNEAAATPCSTGPTIIDGVTISSDTTWSLCGSPYVLRGDVWVYDSSVMPTLTIEPGTTIQFDPAYLPVYQVGGNTSGDRGALSAVGSVANPILFTSTSGAPSPGEWSGIWFGDGADDAATVLEHCVIEYGGNTEASIYCEKASPTISHCTVQYGMGYAISADPVGDKNIQELTLTGNEYDAVQIRGGLIDGTGSLWRNPGAGNRYILTDLVEIYDGSTTATLTIEAGTTVAFDYLGELYVGGVAANLRGALVAQGAAGEMITFTAATQPPSPGAWGTIWFNIGAANAGSVLDYCLVEYGGSTEAAVYCENASPAISNTTIQDSMGYPLSIPPGADTDLQNLTLTGNAYDAVEIRSGRIGAPGAVWGAYGVNSRYVLTDYVEVYDTGVTATLTIEPGVTIALSSMAQVYIGSAAVGDQGALVAVGAPGNLITITSASQFPSPGDWGSIYFEAGAEVGASILDYCVVEYGANTDATIHCTDTSPAIHNSTIQNGSSYAISIPAEDSPDLQNLTLTGNGYDAVQVRSGRIGAPGAVWSAYGVDSRYLLTDFVEVYDTGATATLTIEPGVTIAFEFIGQMYIGGGTVGQQGALVAQGAPGNLITFTSASQFPSPGDWGSVYFERGADVDASIVDYCLVEYGGNTEASIYCANASPVISNSTIQQSASYPISGSVQADLDFQDLTLTGNVQDAVEIRGGRIDAPGATWRAYGTNSRYVVTNSDVLVYGNTGIATLTIAPGVTVACESTGFDIGGGIPALRGALVANGTDSLPITFTSPYATPSPSDWSGIRFRAGTDDATSVLNHCFLEYGGFTGEGVIYCEGATPTIRNSTVRYGSPSGLIVNNATGTVSMRGGEAYGHSGYGVEVMQGLCDARLTWWADASGPMHASNPNGFGEPITDMVVYNPWLGAPPTDPFRFRHAEAPGAFSQIGGRAVFYATMPEDADWQIQVFDASDVLRRTMTGSGIRIEQTWDGEDDSLLPLPDGTYRYQIDVTSHTAAPVIGLIDLDGLLPVGMITSPGNGTQLTEGDLLSVVGTATGTGGNPGDFQSYVVEYGLGWAPSSWVEIDSGSSAVIDDVLTTWSVPGLGLGPVTLRLRVTNTGGYESQTSVSLWASGAEPPAFSPNGDGVKDTTTIRAQFDQTCQWTLTIENAAQQVVLQYAGSGQDWIAQVWDGYDDGVPATIVPDGVYTYHIDAQDPPTGFSASFGGRVIVDTVPPIGVITDPTTSENIWETAAITGTATDPDSFNMYTVEQGPGSNPTAWTTIATGNQTVSAGLLANWQTQAVANGEYTIRLTVEDGAGNPATASVTVNVLNLWILNVSRTPVAFDPLTGSVTVFYELTVPADVSIIIYDEETQAEMIRIVDAEPRPAGINADAWDGLDTNGFAFPLDAYTFAIMASDADGRNDTYDRTDQVMTSPWTDNAAVYAANFDPYLSRPAQIEFEMFQIGRITIQILGAGFVGTVIDNMALDSGVHTIFWDGRMEDGTIYAGTWDVYFGAPFGLPDMSIILASQSLQIANLQCEAYQILPSYSQVSTILYDLSRAAEVSVALQDPDGNHFRTLLSGALQSAGPQSVVWDGRNDNGEVISIEGDYMVTVQALDVQTQISTVINGTVVAFE